MANDGEVPDPVLERVRAAAATLPEAREEAAWVGTRWRVGSATFAHVLAIAGGWPPAYARASGLADGVVLMVRSEGPELDVLRQAGPPFFAPPWRVDEVGVVLGDGTDWDEVAELVTESFCTRAPARLVRLLDRPEPS